MVPSATPGRHASTPSRKKYIVLTFVNSCKAAMTVFMLGRALGFLTTASYIDATKLVGRANQDMTCIKMAQSTPSGGR